MDIRTASAFVTRPGRNYVLVKLETADGRVGWGDATLNGREKAVEAALLEHILPEIERRDAERIEDIWQLLFRNTYWRGGPVLNSALSGVDMALWDLKGKRAGLPVYELLGGRTRAYAAVYDHCGDDSVEAIVSNCHRAADMGITHYRINLSTTEGEYVDSTRLVDATREIRDELGPEAELLIDVHGRATPDRAAALARRLEPVDLFFLEDPIRPERNDSLQHVRDRTTTPLAVGELFTDPWKMIDLVERDLVDYVRVDLSHVGGITAASKIASVAEHHYARTAFHGPIDLSPVGLTATTHVDLSVPNFGIQEVPEYVVHDDVYPELDAIIDGGVTFDGSVGGLDVTDDPGLGIEIDEERAREFEFERSHLPTPRNPDGSVQDW